MLIQGDCLKIWPRHEQFKPNKPESSAYNVTCIHVINKLVDFEASRNVLLIYRCNRMIVFLWKYGECAIIFMYIKTYIMLCIISIQYYLNTCFFPNSYSTDTKSNLNKRISLRVHLIHRMPVTCDRISIFCTCCQAVSECGHHILKWHPAQTEGNRIGQWTGDNIVNTGASIALHPKHTHNMCSCFGCGCVYVCV